MATAQADIGRIKAAAADALALEKARAATAAEAAAALAAERDRAAANELREAGAALEAERASVKALKVLGSAVEADAEARVKQALAAAEARVKAAEEMRAQAAKAQGEAQALAREAILDAQTTAAARVADAEATARRRVSEIEALLVIVQKDAKAAEARARAAEGAKASGDKEGATHERAALAAQARVEELNRELAGLRKNLGAKDAQRGELAATAAADRKRYMDLMGAIKAHMAELSGNKSLSALALTGDYGSAKLLQVAASSPANDSGIPAKLSGVTGILPVFLAEVQTNYMKWKDVLAKPEAKPEAKPDAKPEAKPLLPFFPQPPPLRAKGVGAVAPGPVAAPQPQPVKKEGAEYGILGAAAAALTPALVAPTRPPPLPPVQAAPVQAAPVQAAVQAAPVQAAPVAPAAPRRAPPPPPLQAAPAAAAFLAQAQAVAPSPVYMRPPPTYIAPAAYERKHKSVGEYIIKPIGELQYLMNRYLEDSRRPGASADDRTFWGDEAKLVIQAIDARKKQGLQGGGARGLEDDVRYGPDSIDEIVNDQTLWDSANKSYEALHPEYKDVLPHPGSPPVLETAEPLLRYVNEHADKDKLEDARNAVGLLKPDELHGLMADDLKVKPTIYRIQELYEDALPTLKPEWIPAVVKADVLSQIFNIV